MIKLHPFFGTILLLGLCMTAARSSGQAADPVAEALSDAKEAYRKSMAEAMKAALLLLDEADAKAREVGNLDLVNELKRERAAFEGEGIIPRRLSGTARSKGPEKSKKAAADAFLNGARRAKAAMGEAYTKAVKAYLLAKRDEDVRRVKGEMDAFLMNPLSLLPAGAGQAGPARDDVIGRWVLRNDGELLMPVDFLADNSLRLYSGEEGKWAIAGDLLTLNVPDPTARDGVKVDRMKLSRQGDRMDGKAANGKAIFAVRIADRREMLKWQEGGFDRDPRMVWKSTFGFVKNTKPGVWEFGSLPLDSQTGGPVEEVARTEKYIYLFDKGRWTYLTRLGAGESLLMSGHDATWRATPDKGTWVVAH